MSQKQGFLKRLFGSSAEKGIIERPNFRETNLNLSNSFLKYVFGNSGLRPTQIKYFENSPLVYMIIDRMASVISNIDVVAKDQSGEDLKISRVLELLEKPNSKQSYSDLMYDAIVSYASTGNLFFRLVKGVGAGEELTVLKPQCVEDIITDDFGDPTYYKYKLNWRTSAEKIPAEEISHIKTTTITRVNKNDSEFGVSPLEAMSIVVSSSNEKFNADASIFKNRGIIGILTSKGNVPLLKPERDRIQKEMDDEVGGSDQYNKIKISQTELQYIQTGMSPTDLKLIEGVLSSLRMLCAAYGLSSVLFNDNENSSYNNVYEAKKSAYNDCYLPLNERILSKLSLFLSNALGVVESVTSDLNSIEEIRATTNKLMTSLNSLEPTVAREVIQALRINDVLDMLGLDLVDEDQNTFLSKNTTNERKD